MYQLNLLSMTLTDAGKTVTLTGSDCDFGGVRARFDSGKVMLETSPASRITALELDFGAAPFDGSARVLGDGWERSYADLGWRDADRCGILPWYFLAYASKAQTVYAFGVKTRPSAVCWWTVGGSVALRCDLRAGNAPLEAGGRTIDVCEVVCREYFDRPFEAAKRFCRELCPDPRLPASQIYGGNDWYCSYGSSDEAVIAEHASRVAECAAGLAKRPYMVVDDGWELCSPCTGPWRYSNRRFPDMAKLAETIKAEDVKPGIWVRPLSTAESLPAGWFSDVGGERYLDPSVPETLEYVRSEIRAVRAWGYELVKTDYVTYDLTRRWGYSMTASSFGDTIVLRDHRRTTAEVIKDLYAAIREAAGSAAVIGCNAVGHLCAGYFEAQRTGDDTSGREWKRTLCMGVNTLAYRLPQDKAFFSADPDCVGITREVPFEYNRRWLELIARSGEALFVSIARGAYDAQVKEALKAAFALAAAGSEAEPLDWLDPFRTQYRRGDGADIACALPQRWKTGDKITEYDWQPTLG